MQIFLSKEIWDIIYSFDPTKREQHAKVCAELKKVLYLFQAFVACDDPYRFARKHTKEEMEALCRYLHIKVPKQKTKSELMMLLHSYVDCIIPGSFEFLRGPLS